MTDDLYSVVLVADRYVEQSPYQILEQNVLITCVDNRADGHVDHKQFIIACSLRFIDIEKLRKAFYTTDYINIWVHEMDQELLSQSAIRRIYNILKSDSIRPSPRTIPFRDSFETLAKFVALMVTRDRLKFFLDELLRDALAKIFERSVITTSLSRLRELFIGVIAGGTDITVLQRMAQQRGRDHLNQLRKVNDSFPIRRRYIVVRDDEEGCDALIEQQARRWWSEILAFIGPHGVIHQDDEKTFIDAQLKHFHQTSGGRRYPVFGFDECKCILQRIAPQSQWLRQCFREYVRRQGTTMHGAYLRIVPCFFLGRFDETSHLFQIPVEIFHHITRFVVRW